MGSYVGVDHDIRMELEFEANGLLLLRSLFLSRSMGLSILMVL